MRLQCNYQQKAIFLDRDGVLNQEVGHICHVDDFHLMDNVSQAIKCINQSDYLAIVITNQSAVARGLCTIDDIEHIHKKMEMLLGDNGAHIDAIYYCPHHPEKGMPGENPLYTINCDCRKPKIGMITHAAKDFNIDLKHSYFIGDTTRDILCGKNAHLYTIGVYTGHGCKDGDVKPDWMFEDLYEAVSFIIHDPLKPHIQNIMQKIKVSPIRPFVILIGGNTRSGKSTLAHYLALELRDRGENVVEIALDNWLLPKEKRIKYDTVYERFQLEKIEKDCAHLFASQEIALPSYNCVHRITSTEEIIYSLHNKSVVIVEGVVALSSQTLRRFSALSIYCDIEEQAMKNRIFSFYTWKGLSESEINNLYKKRKKDEYDIIRKEKCYADMIIENTL
ncbi:MAG: HAD-IIIA family hydrolase [bacterium]